MTADDPEGDKEVGYGRPPQHTRFKTGQSGNPSGRKKKPKTAQEILDALLNQSVTFVENGKKVRMTKKEFILKKTVHQACKGDPRDLARIMKQLNLTIDGKTFEEADILDESDGSGRLDNLYKRLKEEL